MCAQVQRPSCLEESSFRRVVSVITATSLLVSMFAFTLNIQRASAGSITVPDDYPTIQAAIDAANSGDTVRVRSGTYNESVTVSKSVSVIGSGPYATTIDSESNQLPALAVTANNVLVQGLRFMASRLREGMPPHEEDLFIVIVEGDNCAFTNNIVQGIPETRWVTGILLRSCTGSTVESSKIRDLHADGIRLWDSSNNIIRENVINGVSWGINLITSKSNVLESNIIEYTNLHFPSPYHAPGVPHKGLLPPSGISIGFNSRSNKVIGNSVTNNSVHGLSIGNMSSNNLIVDNTISSNGILSPNSWDTNYNVWVNQSTGNIFYHNYFDNQSTTYCEHGSNIWDDGYPSGGNYWKDYEGADVNKGPNQNQPGSDGIGDTPIKISDTNDQDRYPLLYPFGSPPPPTHELTITSAANGTTDPAPGSYIYSEGQNVPVQALPNTGYVLDYWELDGADTGAANPVSVAMNTDHALHSTFTWAGICELTITTTTGGTTIPAPGTEVYTKGTVVTVNALPDVGYVFDHWELDSIGFGTAESVNVTMDIDHTLHAAFTPTYNLTITATTGGATNPKPGTYTYTHGTVVTVTAIPDTAEDYYFDYWILDGAENSSNPVNVKMAADHALHAVFALTEYTLTLTTSTGGTTNPPAGTHIYSSGTEVSVTAIPDGGYYLDYWMLDGAIIGYISLNPAVINMEANHTLHAAFAQLSSGHDVAVKSVSSPKTVVAEGYTSNINTLTMNVGSYTETFNVTTYVDETPIASQNVTLESGAFITLTSTWNTTGFDKGNYTIKAVADTVPDETSLEDNTVIDGWIIIAMVGDITGDGKCDIKDLAQVAKHYGQFVPPAPANCDLTGPTKGLPDGKIDIRDIALVAIHYGEVDL